MNWTKTPPTRAGVYLFLPKYGKPEAVLLYQNQHDHLLYQEGQNHSADSWDGQWSGLFVPVEEVFKAYREGYSDGADKHDNRNYLSSRARRIVGGEQV